MQPLRVNTKVFLLARITSDLIIHWLMEIVPAKSSTQRNNLNVSEQQWI